MIKQLMALTEAPREIDQVEVDLLPNEDFAALYKNCRDEVYREIEKRNSKPTVDSPPLPKEILPCIAYILRENPKTVNTTFNKLVMNIASYFQGAGYDYDLGIEYIKPFLTNYPHSTSYITPDKRLKHFDDQWKYLIGKNDYNFDCSYIRGLGFPGSAFECSRCALNTTGNGVTVTPEPSENLQKKNEALDFPDVMAGAALKTVEIYRRYIEAPDQFIYMTFITLLGAVLARSVTLDTIFKVQTRLYTILIGPSGRSRKSTVIGLMTDLFKDLLTHDFKLDLCRGVGSDVGLAKRLKKSDSLVLAIDEFRSLTSKSGIRNSALLPTISTLFDRNEYSNYVKSEKDSIDIEDAYLSMIAASTPETFEEIWSSSFTNIGLNNRLFLVPGTGVKAPLPKDILPHEINAIRFEIGKILGVVGGGVQLVLTNDAEDLYNDWYMNLEDSVHSQRLEAYCLRLACILAVNELSVQVDENIILKAIALCVWQLTARKVHDPVIADNKIAELEMKIKKHLEVYGDLTERKLRQKIRPERHGIWFFQQAINNLLNIKDIIKLKPQQGSRQRTVSYKLIQD